MELESSVAEGIRLTDDKARYDAACKRLLSEKILLAWIMLSCLEEYQGCSAQEIAEKYIEGMPEISTTAVYPDQTNAPKIIGANTEDKTLTEGTVFYDIRFYAVVPGSGERIRLLINIEAQDHERLKYALVTRGIYYCCRMISAQYGTEFIKAEYQNLKKVYSVWLCFDPAKDKRNTITKYRLTEENLIGRVCEERSAYDLLTVVMVRLGAVENEKNILRLLNILFSKEYSAEQKKQLLKDDFDIPMVQEIERRLNEVCNLGQGIEDRGIAIGEKRGIMIGEKRGLESAVNALMQNLHISREEAKALLGLPKEPQS